MHRLSLMSEKNNIKIVLPTLETDSSIVRSADESQQIEAFTNFLKDLSNRKLDDISQKRTKCILLDNLKKIYSSDFRHLYSEIFRLMIKFDKNIEDNSQLYNLNENIKILYDYVNAPEQKDQYDDAFKKKVFKLYDHITLEYLRIAYWVNSETDINEQLTKAKKRLKSIEKMSTELNENVDNAKKEAENLKSSQVTVLGIFISILVGLLGQVYVVGKSLSSVTNGENLGPLLILIIVASAFTISAVIALLYVVSKIIDKNILSKCSKSDTCNTCNHDSNKCNFIKKLKYRLPYLYGLYQLSLVLLSLVGVFFYIPLEGMYYYILIGVALILAIKYMLSI